MRVTTPRPKSALLQLVLSVLFLLSLPLHAQQIQQLFGPRTFTRATGSPVVETVDLGPFSRTGEYQLRIANDTVSSAIVKLNGTEIFGTHDFNQQVASLSKVVTVSASANQLTVELRGSPGEKMHVSLWGPANADSIPPTITVTAAPAPNATGWNNTEVLVAFRCFDADSGVEFCPALVTVTTEGANQVISGTARDIAGNTATASVTVSIDRTAPSIVVASPTPGATLTTETVNVTGSVSDALNPIAAVTCNGVAATLAGGSFACSAAFEDGQRGVVVAATDTAGNTSSTEVRFNVLTTPAVQIVEPENLSFLNISPITVRGTASDTAATVHVNGVAAAKNGTSWVATVPIVEGNNTLTAVARTATGKIGTGSVQVTLDTTPPRVAVRAPADGFETSEATVSVSGTVNDIVVGTVNDEQAQVTVNGIPATVANRTFIAPSVPLSLGNNAIQVVARDRVGNSFTARVDVTRIAPPAASIRVAGGNQQTGAIGATLSTPLAVTVTSNGGVPAANVPVVFRVTEGNGVISANNQSAPWLVVYSDATGRAEVRYQLGTRAGAGNNKVEATATGFGGTAQFTASATTGAPVRINIDAGLSQTGATGSALAFPFVAVVTDAGHNRLPGVPVTFTVTHGGGKLQNGESTLVTETDSDGRALAVLTLGMEPGYDNNAVEATFPGNGSNAAAFTATAKTPGAEGNTRISGVVLDNSNQPLAGATMRLYQAYLGSASNIPVAVATPVVTNEQGQFTITNAPIGAYKLVADGTTIPSAERYPTLEFDVVTVAGQETTVGLPIYLPVLDRVNRICVDETTGGTLTLPGVPGFSFTVAPGSATFPGGSRTGCVTVTPVHGDKVPMVPGFGQQPRFVITVQPVGTHFNPPAQVSFPNVDGLAPREVTEMYSYDHDLSTFVAIGTGTVSDDGSVLRSDPGVGVMKAGWHCGGNPNPTGSAATCPDCKKCSGTNCVPDPTKTGTLDDNWCCFNGEKIPKYGNSLEVLESKCPKRTQDNNRPHPIDGCSLPGILAILTPGLSVQDPVGGNLGHISTRFGQEEGDLPPGVPAMNLPCNQHDICYQTCKSVQANCDTGMYNGMMAVCNAAYPESSCPYSGIKILLCPTWYREKADCSSWSSTYKWGLDKFGHSAWKERQEQFCKCCP